MGFDYATVLVFAVCAVGFCLSTLLIGALLRPRFPSSPKLMTYECGEVPQGEAWFNYNPRFYVIALVFVIFEVEIALMLPVVLVYRTWIARRHGGVAFAEILAFVLILAVGLVWTWVHGDLDWVKRIAEPSRTPSAAEPRAAG